MSALRTDVEDAVIAALEALESDQTGGYFTDVVPYNGPIPPDDESAAFRRLVEHGVPIAAVTAAGDVQYDESSITLTHRYARAKASVDVLVVSGNLRSQEAHLRGDDIATDPGLYQIAEDVRDALWGIGLNVDGAGILDPVRETTVRVDERFTAIVFSFELPIAVESPDYEADADEYESIRSKINNADDDTIDPVITQDTDIS